MESVDAGFLKAKVKAGSAWLIGLPPTQSHPLGRLIRGKYMHIKDTPRPTDTEPYGLPCDPAEWPRWIREQSCHWENKKVVSKTQRMNYLKLLCSQ